jgi:hypothetical protein
MLKTFVKTAAGLACLALLAAPAFAFRIAPAPVSVKVAQSDVVVVGKVGKVEDKNVSATQTPGDPNKVEYQVVAFKVDDALLGKAGKEIRIGFLPPRAGGPIRPGLRGPSFVLTTDQECCLFLVKHHAEDFYVAAPMAWAFPDKQNADYEKSVEDAKKCCKLLADPEAGLKSKEADDRLLTAGMLVSRYRTDKTGSGKTEDVPAEQSKLILKTLADADWAPKPQPPGGLFGFQMNPQAIFFQLGLTDKDGWKQPQDGTKIEQEAKKWLKENAESYKMQRFVTETKEKKDK